MGGKEVDIRFQQAVSKACQMTQASLPQHVQIRLYACYKQAAFGILEPRQTSNYHLRNAFKTNAWMQISHLSDNEAKEHYIQIINSL
jgi:acyl-CoA-binding protein